MTRSTMDDVWRRIAAHQGERFETVKGLPFTYSVSGRVLKTDRTDFSLTEGEFAKALDLVPVPGPSQIRLIVRGPSYIWAILHDERIRQGEW